MLVLPAVLRLLGTRVNSLTVRRRSVEGEGTFWYRAARLVMRRPGPVAAGVIVVLVVMVAPFVGVNLTFPDDRVLSEGTAAAVAAKRTDRPAPAPVDQDDQRETTNNLLVPASGASAKGRPSTASQSRPRL